MISFLLLGPSHSVARGSACCLRNLVSQNEHNKDAVRMAGGIPHLVTLLQSPASSEACLHACACLRNLARGNAPNRDAIREAGAIPVFITLLSHDASSEVTAHAAAALANLSFENIANQDVIRDGGGVRPLMGLIGSSPDLTAYASGALANVANPLARLTERLHSACVPVAQMLCPPTSGRGAVSLTTGQEDPTAAAPVQLQQ